MVMNKRRSSSNVGVITQGRAYLYQDIIFPNFEN